MKNKKILTFQEALADASEIKHVLLGNGFSIAFRPNIFSYNSLFEECRKHKCVSPEVLTLFKVFRTRDFEVIIKALNDTAKVLHAYKFKQKSLRSIKRDAAKMKTALVELISSKHPRYPLEINDAQYAACSEFLKSFDRIYTLNYDLLLYWVIMKAIKDEDVYYDDGFRHEEAADYVVWRPEDAGKQNVYYLHGALHLFDTGSEIKKFTWSRTGVTLIEQIKSELEKDNFPLFVAEGTSEEKMTKINHSQYLGRNIRSFANISGSLFVFGHSLADSDDHYLSLIAKNKIEKLYVSLYGDGTKKSEQSNLVICNKADLLVNARLKDNPKRPLSVAFFDASSAKVWG